MVAEYQLQLPDKNILQKKLQELINMPLFPRSNEPSTSLLAFGDCREGQIPRPLGRTC